MEANGTDNRLNTFETKSSIYKKKIEEFKRAFERAKTNDERMLIIQEMRNLSESFTFFPEKNKDNTDP